MAIDIRIPEISALREHVKERFNNTLNVHADYIKLGEDIFHTTREHLSETTLERIWAYSTRGCDNVSVRTLDVLCRYIGRTGWADYCSHLKLEGSPESDMFDMNGILSEELDAGDRLLIGWLPDRTCVVRYLGDNRFIAEETSNSKMQPGDTFTCLQFQLHSPVYLEKFTPADSPSSISRYGIGLKNGITTLQLLSNQH